MGKAHADDADGKRNGKKFLRKSVKPLNHTL
jgi:hypothetical protein